MKEKSLEKYGKFLFSYNILLRGIKEFLNRNNLTLNMT